MKCDRRIVTCCGKRPETCPLGTGTDAEGMSRVSPQQFSGRCDSRRSNNWDSGQWTRFCVPKMGLSDSKGQLLGLLRAGTARVRHYSHPRGLLAGTPYPLMKCVIGPRHRIY